MPFSILDGYSRLEVIFFQHVDSIILQPSLLLGSQFSVCHSFEDSWLLSNFVLFACGFLQLTMMYLGVDLFLFILLEIHWAFRICELTSINSRKFLAILKYCHSSTSGPPNKVFTVSSMSLYSLHIFHLVLPSYLLDAFFLTNFIVHTNLPSSVSSLLLNPSIKFFSFSVLEFLFGFSNLSHFL